MNVIQWLVDNGQSVLDIVVGLLGVAIAISMLVPGDQPEKVLQSIVDVIKKFSKK